MRLLLPLRIALKALRANIMRTLLTMLGVIIGVGAVICTVSIGEGASAKIREAIVNIGANLVWVEAGGVNRNGVRTGSGDQDVDGGGHARDPGAGAAHRATSPRMVDTRVQLVFGNQNWNCDGARRLAGLPAGEEPGPS